MSKNKKPSNQDSTKVIKDVQAILRRWDPIEVNPGEFAPADEYDSYAQEIISMVVQDCTVNELSKHLEWLRTIWMSMNPNPERDLEIAIEIISALRSD